MSQVDTKLNEYRRCGRPVMFLNDSVEHPYSGCGSCFVVSYKSKLYVVTVNHLFKNRLYTEMTTYVNENSDSLFSFNRVFSIEIPDLEDDDFSDIVIYTVDDQYHRSDEIYSLDIEEYSNLWIEEPKSYDYMIFGYPDLYRTIDSEDKLIYCAQKCIGASYIEPAVSECCHMLKIRDSNGTEEYNGFSGSPVISWKRQLNGHLAPSFSGMALRATKLSEKIMFLESSFVIAALDKASRS